MSSFYGGGAASNDSSGNENTVNNNSIYKFFIMDEEASEEAHPQGIASIQEIIWKWEQGQTPGSLDDFFIPVLKVQNNVGFQYSFPFVMRTYSGSGSDQQKIVSISAGYDSSQGDLSFVFSYDEQNPGNINITVDDLGEGGKPIVQ